MLDKVYVRGQGSSVLPSNHDFAPDTSPPDGDRDTVARYFRGGWNPRMAGVAFRKFYFCEQFVIDTFFVLWLNPATEVQIEDRAQSLADR